MIARWVGAAVFLAVIAADVVAQGTPDIRVTPLAAEGRLDVSFAAGAALGPDARAMVESGLLVTLSFAIDLKRPATGWWDRTVVSTVVSSTIKLDTLTGTYHVSRLQQGHGAWSERTREFAEARDWATSFERVPLADGEGLDPNAEYYIEVRMSASPRRTFSLWPFGSDGPTGRAAFTFIR